MKEIRLELHSCDECPYRRYDPHYSMSYDSGYDCGHEDTPYGQGRLENDSTGKTFEGNFPQWCPLPQKKGRPKQ